MQKTHLLLITSALLAPGLVFADPAPTQLPNGGTVAAGSATISQSGTRMDINQSSQRAVINWDSFSVGSQAWVNFNQPNASAATLNRVTGGTISEIFGKITATGQVFIINPAGIVFGQGAQVNVGGLVGSTMSIRNEDFMAGQYRFERNGSTGAIVNRGNLSAADGGYIALLAPELRNEGVVSARLGTVALAAGEAVVLQVGERVTLQVEPATVQTLVENRAMILAEGGRAILSSKAVDALMAGAINTTGVVRADSLVERGGEIILEASGALNIGGTVSANGTSGGTITANANGAITVTDATITADGSQGAGGRIDLGSWASTSNTVNAGSRLSASAGQTGNGGSINVFSQDTRFAGQAVATGGSTSGNGGFIETSGIQLNIDGARVNAGAAFGQAGTWLIDPNDLTIGASGASALSAALATTSVTLTTSGCPSAYATCAAGDGNVTINASITPTVTGNGMTFIIRADGGISLSDNTSIAASGNALTVQFEAGTTGGIYIGNNSSIITRGGSVIMTGGGTSTTAQGVAGSNGGRGLFINGSIIDAGGGSFNLRGRAADGVATSFGIDIASGSRLTTSGSGQIQLNGFGGNSTGGGGFSSGVNIGSGVEIVSGSQAITINGTQATTSTNTAYGISFDGGSQQTALYASTGNVLLTATSGTIGFSTPNGSSTVALGWDGVSGTPTTGTVNLTADNVQLDSANVVTIKAANSNISADALTVSNSTTVTASTQATVYSSSTIGIGSGTGSLNLSDAMLGRFQTSTIFNIGSLSGGAISIGGTVAPFTTKVRFISGGTVTLENGASISSTASGTALVLASNTAFVNNGGTIDTSNGRWQIRSVNPANDTRGSLTGFERYSCSVNPLVNCANLPATGNGFTYTIAGTDIGGFTTSSTGSTSSVADQARNTFASTDSSSISRDTTNVTTPRIGVPTDDTGRPRIADLRAIGESPLVALELGYTVNNLRAAGYSIEELRAAGIPLADIKDGRYSPVYVKQAGYSVDDMLAAGYGLKDLNAAGYSIFDLKTAGVPLADLKANGYPLADLKAAGFTATDFRDAGVPLADLRQGYPVADLRTAGFSASELLSSGVPTSSLAGGGYTVGTLRDAGTPAGTLRGLGYSVADLADAGYTPVQLRDAGFPTADLDAYFGTPPSPRPATPSAPPPTPVATAPAGPQPAPEQPSSPTPQTTTAPEPELPMAYRPRDTQPAVADAAPPVPVVLPKMPDVDYSKLSTNDILAMLAVPEISQLGIGQRASYPAVQEIRKRALADRASSGGLMTSPANVAMIALDAWRPGTDLASAMGWAAEYAPTIASPLWWVQIQGFNLMAMQQDWMESGARNMQQYKDHMIAETGKKLAASYQKLDDIKSGRATEEANQQAAQIMQDIAQAQADTEQKLAAINAQIQAQAQTQAQAAFAGENQRLLAGLAQLGQSVRDQQNAVERMEMTSRNMSVRQLLDSGVSASHLLDIGYVDLRSLATQNATAADLRASGIPISALKTAGVSPAEMRQLGYSTADLLAGGYTLADIPASAITVNDIRTSGMSAAGLTEAGFTPAQLRSMGLSAADLRNAGFPVATLRANYSAAALHAAGIPATDLRAGGASAASLLSAGFSAGELRAAGFSTGELAAVGV